MTTNIVVYFDDNRMEVEVKETIDEVTEAIAGSEAPVIFKRERGGAVVINPAKVQYMLLTEGGD